MTLHRFFSQKGCVSQRKDWKGWGGNIVTLLFQLAKMLIFPAKFPHPP